MPFAVSVAWSLHKCIRLWYTYFDGLFIAFVYFYTSPDLLDENDSRQFSFSHAVRIEFEFFVVLYCIVFDVHICVQPISICTQSFCMLNKSNCSWYSIWWIASWYMFYSGFPCFVMAFSSVEICKQLVIWFSWFVDIHSENDKRFETFSCFI